MIEQALDDLTTRSLERIPAAKLARLWGCQHSTVRTYCRTGKIDAELVAGEYVVSHDAARRFLRERKVRKS